MNLIILTILTLFSLNSFANAPKVGRAAAAKYFQAQGKSANDTYDYEARRPSSVEALGVGEHFLAVGIGSFSQTDAYKWGQDAKQEDVGKFGVDMTYRLTPDSTLFDQALRVSYNEFKPVGQHVSKLSFMYALTLPDAGSQFPLYFGVAAGPGIFLKQLDGESSLSLDYQLFLGLRLFNVFEKVGFYVEGGMRNHLQLTSDGQLNGTFISAGAVFTF